jgi:hypothetical protein
MYNGTSQERTSRNVKRAKVAETVCKSQQRIKSSFFHETQGSEIHHTTESLSVASRKSSKGFLYFRSMVILRAIYFPHRYLNTPLGRATVIRYDETSPLQNPIPADCFYTRREYNSSHGFITVCMTLVLNPSSSH